MMINNLGGFPPAQFQSRLAWQKTQWTEREMKCKQNVIVRVVCCEIKISQRIILQLF